MKKVKTLLVSAIAALSLSACSLQDAIDWTKNAGGQVGGFFTSLLEKVGLKKPDEKKEEKEDEKPCNHEDKNHDGVCDLCGATGLEVVHVDENHDHACDVCGAAVSQHADADNDFKCDECGAELAIVDVRLDTTEAQLYFAKGEEFSADGLRVIATSEVGSEKDLEFTVSEVDTSTVGDKPVVVTYGEGENDKLEYEINVSYWSEDDLAIFKENSLVGYASPLPYLAGYDMRVEVSENGDSWWIQADSISAEAYLDYNNMLLEWYDVVKVSGRDVTFELTQLPVDGEGFHGLSDVQVYDLIPSYIDDEGYPSRRFIEDEIFVVGINESSSLIIETRRVNAILDGLFGNEVLDGTSIYYASVLNPYFSMLLEYYYSELSADALILPEVSADAGVTVINYATRFPLEEYLDQFDLSWLIEYPFSTQEEFDAYVATLLANNYEKVEYASGAVSYVFEDELYGCLEIFPTFEEDLGILTDGTSFSGISLEFYFNAPESYTNHLDLDALYLGELLEVEFELDNSDYEDYGIVGAYGDFAQGQYTNGGEVAEYIARSLLDVGFDVVDEIEYDDEYDQYGFLMAGNGLGLTFWVDAEAEDGFFGLEVYLYDKDSFEVSNAEQALQVTFENFAGFKALKGVDYVENENETFSVRLVVLEDASADYLQAGAEGIAQFLPATFELASSEAGEEGTWVAVFNDVANDVQVTAVSSLDESNNLICSATFANYKFITPETTMVAFLTAHNGAAPSEQDYEVGQDGSCLAEIAFSGEHAAADLQELAEGLAAEFGEGFEKVSSEADGEDWIAVYDNEETGIRVTILVSLEDTAASAIVETSLIPTIRADELAMIEILTNLWGSVDEGDYTYNAQNDLYVAGWYSLGSNYTSPDYNQPIAEFIASKAGDSFQIVQAGVASVAAENDAYRVILLDPTTMVVIQITVFVHPTAGLNVFQILTYLY